MGEKDEPRGRRARTRAALLDAAAKMFVARGYEAASLDDIAAAAGFTRGAIYSSFDDKEDLFLAVVTAFDEKWISNFERAIRQAEEAGLTSSASITALWKEFASSDEQQTRLMMEFRVVALRNKTIARKLAQFEKRMEETMASIVQDHVDAGLLHPVLPVKDLAVLMYSASQGILLHQLGCRSSHPDLFGSLITLALTPPADGVPKRRSSRPRGRRT